MRNTLKRASEYYLLQRERDELLVEKLSVVQNMIITDRIIGLGVLAAGLSQHLRNPLDAVRTFLHQTPAKLRYEDLDMNRLRDPDFWRDFHNQVLNQAHHVSELVGLLDGVSLKNISAVEQPCDPLGLIFQVVEKLQPQTQARGIQLKTDFPASLPALHVDPAKFTRMFELLLGDELMNLPEGATINLGANIHCLAGSPVKIQFTLSDDGPGIPQDSLRSVFDPFSIRTGMAEKFGLNLLGVFFLAHHYGGSVKATDSHGKGVTYTIDLPVTSGAMVDVSSSSEEFVTKVLMNDTLWEKLLSGV
jgi:two-component system probable response regulator PhcQ